MSQVISPNRRIRLAPTADSHRAIVVHALHKSASMFLHELFQDLASRSNTPYYSIHNADESLRIVDSGHQGPFIQCPVRSFALNQNSFPNGQLIHVCQIRDPRDILVSQYFSLGWIHSAKNWSPEEKELRQRIQAMTVDQYVLQEADISNVPLLERYSPLLNFRNTHNCLVVRYEDMVLRFRQWLKPIIALFEVRLPWLLNYQLRRKFGGQFKVSTEKMQHRRRITPGDHLEKLQPETIEKLNLQYAEILSAFGYAD